METLRQWWGLNARQRQGAAVILGVYLIGYAFGRSAGKIQVLERLNAGNRHS